MRLVIRLFLAVAALALAAFAWLGVPATGAGMAAKNLCSGVFVAGRAPADVLADDVLPASSLLRLVDTMVDEEARLVRSRLLWSRERVAMLLPGLGCVLDPTAALVQAARAASAGVPGAAADITPAAVTASGPFAGVEGDGFDRAAVAAVVEDAFLDTGAAAGRNTRAVVILHHGRLLAERYAPGFDAGTPQLGWSMSKTVLGLLVYMKLQEQRRDAAIPALDWVAPARRPGWLQDWTGDTRQAITIADLMFMRDGLEHREGYEPWSAVPRMLWGVADVPAYAGSAPPEAPAGERFRYLSATTNILSRLLRAQFDSDEAYWRYPAQALFGPLGAASAVFESDASGTFIGSSYLWATPLDWARIGQLLLRDGALGEQRVFPPGWLRFASSPPPSTDPAALGYGAQVWLPGAGEGSSCGPDHRLPADTLFLSGHWGQVTAVVPSREAVIVRLGMTLDRTRFDRCAFVRSVLTALPPDRESTPR